MTFYYQYDKKTGKKVKVEKLPPPANPAVDNPKQSNIPTATNQPPTGVFTTQIPAPTGLNNGGNNDPNNNDNPVSNGGANPNDNSPNGGATNPNNNNNNNPNGGDSTGRNNNPNGTNNNGAGNQTGNNDPQIALNTTTIAIIAASAAFLLLLILGLVFYRRYRTKKIQELRTRPQFRSESPSGAEERAHIISYASSSSSTSSHHGSIGRQSAMNFNNNVPSLPRPAAVVAGATAAAAAVSDQGGNTMIMMANGSSTEESSKGRESPILRNSLSQQNSVGLFRPLSPVKKTSPLPDEESIHRTASQSLSGSSHKANSMVNSSFNNSVQDDVFDDINVSPTYPSSIITRAAGSSIVAAGGGGGGLRGSFGSDVLDQDRTSQQPTIISPKEDGLVVVPDRPPTTSTKPKNSPTTSAGGGGKIGAFRLSGNVAPQEAVYFNNNHSQRISMSSPTVTNESDETERSNATFATKGNVLFSK